MTNGEFRNTNDGGLGRDAACETGTMAARGVTTMRTFTCLAVVFVLALGAIAQNPGQSKSEDEQALRRIELQMSRGEQQNDWSKMSAMADDWIALGRNAVSREQAEQAMKHAAEEHGSNPYTVEKKNMRVDLFSETAVVTYTKEYRQTADTSKVAYEDDTDVFTRTPAGWRLRFTRTSPVWPPLTSQ